MDLQSKYVGDYGNEPKEALPPTPSQLPPSLSDPELRERIEIRVNNKIIISTSARSIDLTQDGISKVLREIADILDAPEQKDSEFF